MKKPLIELATFDGIPRERAAEPKRRRQIEEDIVRGIGQRGDKIRIVDDTAEHRAPEAAIRMQNVVLLEVRALGQEIERDGAIEAGRPGDLGVVARFRQLHEIGRGRTKGELPCTVNVPIEAPGDKVPPLMVVSPTIPFPPSGPSASTVTQPIWRSSHSPPARRH